MNSKKRKQILVSGLSPQLIKNLETITNTLEVGLNSLVKVEGKNVIKEFDKRVTTDYEKKA